MTNRRIPISTVSALRSTVLLIMVVATLGLPATAGAATTAPAATGTTTPSTTPSTTGPARGDSPSTTTPATPSTEAGRADQGLTVRPAAQTVPEGETATFAASITRPSTSGSPVALRWQTAPTRTGPWADLESAGRVLTATVTREIDGHLFRAVATTAGKPAISAPVTLHVRPLPASTPTTTANPSPARDAPSCPAPAPTTTANPGAPCPTPTPSSTLPSTPPVPADSTHITDPATPASAAETPLTSPPIEPHYGTVARPVLQLGQEQTAIGHHFMPGSRVKVTLEPAGTDLGTYTAAPDGTVTTRFTTTHLTPGTHTIRWTSA